jgi:hypothetical protein
VLWGYQKVVAPCSVPRVFDGNLRYHKTTIFGELFEVRKHPMLLA